MVRVSVLAWGGRRLGDSTALLRQSDGARLLRHHATIPSLSGSKVKLIIVMCHRMARGGSENSIGLEYRVRVEMKRKGGWSWRREREDGDVCVCVCGGGGGGWK